ncbi:MAG: Asp-tRNA(Asn)/Glu-tRNA(Gln) amidotransferase subunit GatB [Candidatus Lokiarchaeota archaeon]
MNEKNEVIIGLEIHIQLTNLKTKLFCNCSTDYREASPNSHTCPVCLGLPGSLPVINKRSVELATRLALALESKINKSMYFFRKNYFYPDLPKGFQISQYNRAGGKAFADGGKISIKLNSNKKDILLNRIHLEEDPGRLVHEGSIASSTYTLIDYNRSGVCLIEIVTEPMINSPEEAREFLNQLRSIVLYTGISDLSLEGSVRVDANISIKGHKRTEIKNINSFKEVERALKWEIRRQRNLIKRGRDIIQETRHWDDKSRITISLRTKEVEKDYRYFPEQDLVPIKLKDEFIEEIGKTLPEMPNERIQRFQKEYKLSEFDSEILVLDKELADFFEKGVKLEEAYNPDDFKQYCNWLKGDISRWLNEHNISISESNLKPKQLVDLIKFIDEGKITGKIAKEFINDIMKGKSIKEIIKKSGKTRIASQEKIASIVSMVIKENQEIVEDYKENPRALEALIGKCMQKTKGQADPKLTRKELLKQIKE